MSSTPVPRPDDPLATRAEIERTRARMSDTLDEIEGVILKKREDLRERLDFGAKLRKDPLRAAAIVLGAGFVVGFLTGGDRKAKERRLEAEARAALWQGRARRLLEIARRQEDELEELEEAAALEPPLTYSGRFYRNVDEEDPEYEEMDLDVDESDEDDEEEDDEPSRFAIMRQELGERAGELFNESLLRVLEGVRRRL